MPECIAPVRILKAAAQNRSTSGFRNSLHLRIFAAALMDRVLFKSGSFFRARCTHAGRNRYRPRGPRSPVALQDPPPPPWRGDLSRGSIWQEFKSARFLIDLYGGLALTTSLATLAVLLYAVME